MADTKLEGLGDEALANAQGISRAMTEIAASSAALASNTGRYKNHFDTVKTSANLVAEIQNKALKTQKAASEAIGQQTKQLSTVRALSVQINSLMEEAAVASKSGLESEIRRGSQLRQQAQHLSDARDNAKELASIYGGIVKDATTLNNSTKFFTGTANFLKNIPVLSKFSTPFEKAAEAARKVAVSNAGVVQQQKQIEQLGKKELETGIRLTKERLKAAGLDKITGNLKGKDAAAKLREHLKELEGQKGNKFGAGIKAAGADMMAMVSPAGILATVFKFILDIFLSVNRQVVEISKNLNVSTDVADKMRLHFNDIANTGDSILMTTQTLIDAQSQLTNSLGVYANLQDSTLRNQVFFTKNLGMSEDAAAGLNLMIEAQGQNAEKVTERMNETNNAASKATGRIVPFNKLMSSVAKTSKEIAGYFGFNVLKIAEGVRQMSKFGLELSDAASVSKTLLDFESSISNELTLELLTGKEFNLEKARSKVLTGDIAGATADVMQQMQGLTEEQRKNPLIMEQMAAMSGLTADQINRAYIVNKKLTKENRDYVKSLQDQGRTAEANRVIDAAAAGQSIDAIKSTITAQDAFAAVLEKLKDKLSGLVNNNILDKFTQILVAFVNTIAKKGFKGLLFGDTFKTELNKAKAADTVSAADKSRKDLDVSKLSPAQQAKLTNTPQMQATAARLQKEKEGGKMGWFSSLINAIQPGDRPNSLLSGNEKDVAKAKKAAAQDAGIQSGKLTILPSGGIVSLEVGQKQMQKQINELSQKKVASALAPPAPAPAPNAEKTLKKRAKGGIGTEAQVAIFAEAGDEAIVPLDEFYRKIDQVVLAVNRLGSPLTSIYAKMDQLTTIASKPSISLTGIYTKMDQLIAATSNKPITKETKPETVNPLTGLYAKMDQLIAVTNKPVTPISLAGIYAKMDQLIAATSNKPITKETKPETADPLTGLYAKLDQLIAVTNKPVAAISLTGIYAKMDQLIAATSSKPITKEVKPETADPLTGLYAKLDQLIAATNKPVTKEAKTEIVVPLTGLYAKLDQLIAVVSKPTTKEVAPEITISLTGLYAKLDQLIAATTKPIAKEAAPEIVVPLTGLYAKLDQLIAVISKPVTKEILPEINIPLTGIYVKLDQLIAAVTKPITKEVAPEIVVPLTGLYAKLDQLITAVSKPTTKEVLPEITIPLTGLYAKLDQLIAVVSKPTTKEVAPEINIPLTGLYAKLDQLIAAISIPTTKEVLPEITIPLTGLYAKLDQLIAAATKPITKEVAPEITIPLTGLYAKLDQLIAVISKPVAKEVLPEITIPLTGLYAKLDQLIAVISKPVVKEVAPEINIPLTGLYAKLDQLIAIVSKPTTKETAPEITIPLTGLYAKLDQLITAVSKPIVNQATPEITISLTGLYAKLDQLIAATSKAEITIPLTGLYAKMDQLIAAATKPITKEAAPEVILPLAGLYAKIDQLIAATGKTEITIPLTGLYTKLDQLIAVTGKAEINIPLTGIYTKLDQLIAVSSTPATTISLTGLYEKIDQLIAATNNKPVVNETKTEIAIPLTGIYAKLDQLIAAAKESVTVIGLDKISSMISSLGEQRSIKKVVDKTPETVEALRNVITPLSTWKDKNKEETKTTPVEEKQIIKPVQTLAAGVGNDTATSLTALYAKMDQLILATKENTAATKETTAAVQKIDINPNLYLGTNKLNETIGLNTHRI